MKRNAASQDFPIYDRFIGECHNRKRSLWHIGKAKKKKKNIGQRVKSAARSPGNAPVLSMASPRLWGRIRLMTHLNKSLRNGNLDEADEGDKAIR